MSFLDSVKHFFTETEQDVLKVITEIKTDVPVAISTIQSGLTWLANETPTIAANVAAVESMISAIATVNPSVASNADVQKAITQANDAVAALNAFAIANKAGTSAPGALVQGYVAFQTAAAAAASAKAAAAAVPTAATTP